MTAPKKGIGLEKARLERNIEQPVTFPESDSKLFIIALRCGRLANRLVLFANFIAFAAEHGHRVANVTFHSYADRFETTLRDIYCRYPSPQRQSVFDVFGAAPLVRKSRFFYHAVRAASVLQHRYGIFGRRMVTLYEENDMPVPPLDGPEIAAQICDAKTVFVYGWRFRAPDCVRRHAEKLRTFFRPITKHEQASRQVVERLRQNADVVAGVHIRLGDYKDWHGGQYYFEVERYASWMRELVAQFPGRSVAFFVCSNEPRRVEEFPGLTVGFGTDVPVEDLYALSNCDYIVAPLGTFSQWSSFYGNKPLFQLRGTDARIELGQFSIPDLSEIP